MEWTADVSAGDWIRDRLDPEGPQWASTMHCVVPHGFVAYARIFHRPTVSWVDAGPFPTQDELRETPIERWPETHSAPTTWRETADVFGTRLHGEAQWHRIVRAARRGDDDPTGAQWQQVIGPDGRQYSTPQEGSLDPAQVSAAAGHLAAASTTPDRAFVAIWEGWGGVLGFFGETPSRAVLSVSDDDDPALVEHHRDMLERSIHDPFNNVFRKPTWQPGILSDEISRGERLRLPARNHVLFTGRVAELADPAWASTVPWAEVTSEWTHSPSLVWPEDRAWVMVTEVDYDSTIVGGSVELVDALCADPALEALPVREGADVSWDGDTENR
jgi:hypothetical protein